MDINRPTMMQKTDVRRRRYKLIVFCDNSMDVIITIRQMVALERHQKYF